ncbi:MAG: hypothetical protein FRX48_03606 [Lasallia pustulata]|uniref:Uncharacterized protein n=1 Tax=Lasallia pustulata TaxID=136370 RepID=A0A5M8PT64_9LECA|nr:MAG: hypothetical protein FRX48_03606 [Lasallia pustulata]
MGYRNRACAVLIRAACDLGPSLVFLSLISIATAANAPTQNITIEVPAGTTNHGNLHLLCLPTKPQDILVFFAANYCAHAATVKVYPGEAAVEVAITVINAILFPTSGIVRGLHSMMRHAVFVRDSLQRAARAGALCMVVRAEDWEPEDGAVMSDIRILKGGSAKKPQKPSAGSKKKGGKDASGTDEENVELTEISPGSTSTILSTYIPPWLREGPHNWSYSDTKDVYTGNRMVHGKRDTPPGYTLAYVPRNAKVVSLAGAEADAEGLDSPVLSSIWGVAKVGISLFQSLYATYTVWQARGDQITRYGYAAFALTVAPYAVMSTLNLIGNMLTPDYPTLYLVRSSMMNEAEKRKGALFEGAVGRLVEIPTNTNPELVDGTFNDVGHDVSGTFSVQDDGNGHTITQMQKSEPSATDEPGDSNPTKSPSATITPLGGPPEPLTLLTKVPDEELPPRYLSLLVPACPRFHRFDDAHVAAYFAANERPARPSFLLFGATLVVNAVIIAIVGGLSHFRKAESTVAQRVWTMMWLVFGFFMGFYIAVIPSLDEPKDTNRAAKLSDLKERWAPTILVAGVTAAPAVGGLVVVAQMLRSYGVCATIG